MFRNLDGVLSQITTLKLGSIALYRDAPYRTLLNMKELPEVLKSGPGFVGQEDQVIFVQMVDQ